MGLLVFALARSMDSAIYIWSLVRASPEGMEGTVLFLKSFRSPLISLVSRLFTLEAKKSMSCIGSTYSQNLCEPDMSHTDNWHISASLPVVFVSVSNTKKL